MALAFLNLYVSCSYYKVQDVTSDQAQMAKEIDNFNKMGRYAIISIDDQSWHLDDLVINEDNQSVSGTIKMLDPAHTYKKPRKESGNRYKKAVQDPMDEIHIKLYPNTNIPENGQQIEIPYTQISSISLNKIDGGTQVFSIIGGTVGAFIVLILIVAALKSSCPFVYIKNGETYDFSGELYPGVITANMERDDFLQLLPDETALKQLGIRITNELKEIQHTDLLELLVVEKIEGVEILLDSDGNPQTFTEIQKPIKVLEDGYKVNNSAATSKDGVAYNFNSLDNEFENTRHLIAEFENKETEHDAKLYVRAKNSLWLDYAFGKFNNLFGTYYPAFQQKQQQSSAKKSYTWMDAQHIPLKVSIKTINGWEEIETINPVGPLAYRNLAIPINLDNSTSGPIQIKLETGFMFWEVDYVGLDFSKNVPVKMHAFQPTIAIDETGKDVTSLLLEQDGTYLTQPNIGNAVDVTFDLERLSGYQIGSVYLKNRGFYNYIRHYTNEPDFDKLRLFRADESFTEFSKLEYMNLVHFASQEDIALHHDK